MRGCLCGGTCGPSLRCDCGGGAHVCRQRGDTTLLGVVNATSGLLKDKAAGASVQLKTVDIIGVDGTSAAKGAGANNFHETNVTKKGLFGVNTDQDQDSGLKSDAGCFNPGEAWVFSFSSDVQLTQIVLVGITDGEQVVRLKSAGFGDIILGADGANNLGGAFVAAGVNVTLLFDSTSGDETFQVESLRFDVSHRGQHLPCQRLPHRLRPMSFSVISVG